MPELSWSAHPAADRPLRDVVLAVALVLGMAAACWLFGGHWAWGVLALVVLVLALNRFFFASRFEIDAQGISAKYPLKTQRLLWRDVRRLVTDSRGGYLSTRSVASRMDAFSGLHLIFSRDRDAIVAAIRQRMTAASILTASQAIAGAAA